MHVKCQYSCARVHHTDEGGGGRGGGGGGGGGGWGEGDGGMGSLYQYLPF